MARRKIRWLAPGGLVVALAGMAAAMSGTAGMAWACVRQPLIVLQPRASGAPGSQVTVNGSGFNTDRAELRWNALDGQLLASADGPDFSTAVTIPAVPPGLYAMVAIMRSPDGAVGNAVRASFEVAPPTGVPATGATPTGAPATGAQAARAGPRRSTSAAALLLAGAGGAAAALLLVALGTVAWRRRTA